MVFSSNVFLFLFLPVFLGLYYLSGNRYRNLLLLVASYIFYAWWRVDFLLLFAGVTVFNYWIGLRIGAAGVRTKAAQRWLLLGVVIDLCVLATSSTPTSAWTASTRSSPRSACSPSC